MTFYHNIFNRSWNVVRKHKALWLFGFFTLFWGGKEMDIDQLFSNGQLLKERYTPFNPEFWDIDRWVDTIQSISTNNGVIALFALMTLALLLVVFIVIVLSQVGLIDAVARYDRTSAKKESYSFLHALKAGTFHFQRAAIVSVLGRLATYAILAIAATPLFIAQQEENQIGFSLLLYLVLAPAAVVVSVITKYAMNDVVLAGSTVQQSIMKAVEMLKNNVGVSIELAVYMLFAFFGVNVAAIVFGYICTVPLFIVISSIVTLFGAEAGLLLYNSILYLFTATALVISSAVFAAWHYGNWTLLYVELTKGSKRSKIHRIWKG